MCHPGVPQDESPGAVERRECRVDLSSGEGIPVTEVCPIGGGSGPGIVLGTDIFGRSAFHLAIADRLALAGFVAVVPDVFFRAGSIEDSTPEAAYARLGELDEPRALADLGAVIDWTGSRSADGPSKVGFVGFCMGGTLALGLAARRTDTVTVCFYGFPAGHPPKLSGLNAAAPLGEAAKMHGPILGFWGADDARVGPDNVVALDEALSAAEVPHDFTIVPGADHGFMSALVDHLADGHHVAQDAWKRTLAFLQRELGAQSAVSAPDGL